jgi:hypothetical protein
MNAMVAAMKAIVIVKTLTTISWAHFLQFHAISWGGGKDVKPEEAMVHVVAVVEDPGTAQHKLCHLLRDVIPGLCPQPTTQGLLPRVFFAYLPSLDIL